MIDVNIVSWPDALWKVMSEHLHRVLVVGTSCSGKTAFAKELARALKSRHIELDALYWKPNWVTRESEEFRRSVAEVISAGRWVVDGNFGTIRDLVWPRATLVVWLNYTFGVVLCRALLRTFRRSLFGEELYSGNRESLARALFTRDSILWWVVSSFRRRRRAYQELRRKATFSHLAWHEFRKPVEAQEFLDSLEEAS